MGYHVTILRTLNGEQYPIRKNEIEAALVKFPNLSVEGNSIYRNEKVFLTIDETIGQLWTKNPQQEELEEILKLSKELKARVRGDELETYKSANETYIHPDDKEIFEKNKNDVKEIIKRTKRKQLIFNVSVFSFLVAMALLVSYCGKGN